jgi:hypothetical protein
VSKSKRRAPRANKTQHPRRPRTRQIAVAVPEATPVAGASVQAGSVPSVAEDAPTVRGSPLDTWTDDDWHAVVQGEVDGVVKLTDLPAAAARSFVDRYFRSATLRSLRHGDSAQRIQARLVLGALLEVEFGTTLAARRERALLNQGAIVTSGSKERAKKARLFRHAATDMERAGLAADDPLVRLVRLLADAARGTRPVLSGPKRRPKDTALIHQLDYGLGFTPSLDPTARIALISRMLRDWYDVARRPKALRNIIAERYRVDARRPAPVSAQVQGVRETRHLTCTAEMVLYLDLAAPARVLATPRAYRS